jgi:hypothetical protein
MMARAKVMHRCGVSGTTQNGQEAQEPNGTHRILQLSYHRFLCAARAATIRNKPDRAVG